MANKIKRYYQKTKQVLAYALGLRYLERIPRDTHNSGGLDAVITKYCAVSGKLVNDKTYLSPESSQLVQEDINGL